MRKLKKFESNINKIENGEYIIWETTTSLKEFYLVKVNIGDNRFVSFTPMYKSENGKILKDNRTNDIQYGGTIEHFNNKTTESVKFHSFDLDQCLKMIELLSMSKKYNL